MLQPLRQRPARFVYLALLALCMNLLAPALMHLAMNAQASHDSATADFCSMGMGTTVSVSGQAHVIAVSDPSSPAGDSSHTPAALHCPCCLSVGSRALALSASPAQRPLATPLLSELPPWSDTVSTITATPGIDARPRAPPRLA